MIIKWYGHSCFLMTDKNGVRVLCDPFDHETTGYSEVKVEADILTMSHGHHDHNHAESALGNPVIIDKADEYEVKGIAVKGIKTYHDDKKGELRGENVMYRFRIDDMNVLHCGDLGEIPSEDVLKQIGEVDVMLVPIGGVYTINAEQARALCNMLHPKAVIPMHYSTPALKFELGALTDFIERASGCGIHRLNTTEAVLEKESLADDRILILSYE